MARSTGVARIATMMSIVLLAIPARSRLSAQAFLETPTERIELVGLHRWTLRMIEDSLAVYAPADGLTDHACAAILRGKLHFADASVQVFLSYPGIAPKRYVAITVIEPQDSSRIHYKSFKYDSIPVRAEWAAAFKEIMTQEKAQIAIQTPSFYAAKLSAEDSAKFAAVPALHALVVERRPPADFDVARHIIETDPAYANRVIAALILASFADRDESWRTLVDALRDPIARVSGVSAQVLGMMTRSQPRVVDWTPVAASLREVVDGTNLFGFNQTMLTLAATKVNPSLAAVLLAGGGDIVRAKLQSTAPGAKEAVAAFLLQLSGLPASSDATVLTRWMDGLAPTSSSKD
jgi:hypothetical protein